MNAKSGLAKQGRLDVQVNLAGDQVASFKLDNECNGLLELLKYSTMEGEPTDGE